MHATAVDTASDFEAAVLELLPDLYAAALRLTRNRADAEDLVADAVSAAWLHRAALRDAGHVRGWIFRILTNTFIDETRTATAKLTHAPIDELSDADTFSLFERLHQPILLWWSNPEQEFLNRLLRSDLEQAIDALPDEYRVVVLLVDVQGFSYQETADVLTVPIGTVRSRLARGRSLLQKALWLHAQDAGIDPGDTSTAAT